MLRKYAVTAWIVPRSLAELNVAMMMMMKMIILIIITTNYKYGAGITQ
jgi:hypothetical protein